MTHDEIRKLNEDCQKKALETETPAAQDAALRSLECSLLAEIAAQLAQLNAGLEEITSFNGVKVQVEPGQYPIVVDERK